MLSRLARPCRFKGHSGCGPDNLLVASQNSSSTVDRPDAVIRTVRLPRPGAAPHGPRVSSCAPCHCSAQPGPHSHDAQPMLRSSWSRCGLTVAAARPPRPLRSPLTSTYDDQATSHADYSRRWWPAPDLVTARPHVEVIPRPPVTTHVPSPNRPFPPDTSRDTALTRRGSRVRHGSSRRPLPGLASSFFRFRPALAR